MSHFRTDTVIRLCEAMRESHDYTALPILADALEDAGYSDHNTLALMREGGKDWIDASRLVALVYSDETMYAVYEMEEMATQAGMHAPEYSRYYNEFHRLCEVYRRRRMPGDNSYDYYEQVRGELSARGITNGMRHVNYRDLMEAGEIGRLGDDYWVQLGSEDLISGAISIDSFWRCWRLISNKENFNQGNPFGCLC